jgi:tripartite-type tricarboxylate transporter receptor subunit TctC
MMTMLKDRFGLDHLHVPYKGGAAVAAAMLSGESHLTIGSVGTYMAQVNAGGLRALLILGSRKPVQYPGIPSTADLGHDLFDGTASLIGFWAPMGTPAEIIGRLNEEFNRSVRSPELGDAFRKAAVDALGTTPQEQLRQAEAELRFLRAAIKIANYQPQ